MKLPTDLNGEPINPGDTIAYAILTGRSATIAIYEVVEITDNGVRARQLARGHSYSGTVNSKLVVLHFTKDRAVKL